MNKSLDPTTIYPDLKAAAAAVSQRWCEEHGYSDRFYREGSWWAYPPNGVMPVNLHQVIDLEHTLARRVRVRYYSIFLSIALLPDGCVAPHNHPEI